jgi:hypothetical protein
VPRVRYGQPKRGTLCLTAVKAVLTTIPIAAEVAAIHKLHIGGDVESYFDDLVSTQLPRSLWRKFIETLQISAYVRRHCELDDARHSLGRAWASGVAAVLGRMFVPFRCPRRAAQRSHILLRPARSHPACKLWSLSFSFKSRCPD